jgi:hypothetical protein
MHGPKPAPASPDTPQNEAPSKPACRQCGKELPERRKLKHFCSYSCRGKHAVKALEAPSYRSGLVGAKNTRHNKGLQSLKRRSIAGFSFAKINSCTIRIDSASKRGAGWLMEVAWPGDARQRWVARVGNRASEPLPLDAARNAATVMLRCGGRGEPRDWVKQLNRIAADEADRTAVAQARKGKQWPLNLMGGSNRPGSMRIDRELREAILDAETDRAADEAP